MGRRRFGAAYGAERAASLAGIPLSTLYYWARESIWPPSVSRTKVMRWSYSDLLGLRLVDWLRQDKPEIRIPKSSMATIRRSLRAVEDFGDRLFEHKLKVWVDRKGGIVLGLMDEVFVPLRTGFLQELVNTEVDLTAAFEGPHGIRAPDLVRPRPTLRIIPGKLSGEPHVIETRITTSVLSALTARGFGRELIIDLFPVLAPENVMEAVDLEEQLERNLRPAA
jgi:uncharacterized protein (DUF433 family)